MLFDEPTSALDPELVGDVLEVMKNLASEGMTMVIVTHEMGFAREVAGQGDLHRPGRDSGRGKPGQIFGAPRQPTHRRVPQQGAVNRAGWRQASPLRYAKHDQQ